jgi:hypothetical protein
MIFNSRISLPMYYVCYYYYYFFQKASVQEMASSLALLNMGRSCVDPFEIHTKKIHKCLRDIPAQLLKKCNLNAGQAKISYFKFSTKYVQYMNNIFHVPVTVISCWAAIQRRGSILAWTVILFMAQTHLQLIFPFLR